jgi:hypothetical protein
MRHNVRLAWNAFCDDKGTVIGRYAIDGNTVHINHPNGATKLVKVRPGEGLLSLVETAFSESVLPRAPQC